MVDTFISKMIITSIRKQMNSYQGKRGEGSFNLIGSESFSYKVVVDVLEALPGLLPLPFSKRFLNYRSRLIQPAGILEQST